MAEEKIQIPLKPWEKACVNAFVVGAITTFSMIAVGDMNNPHVWHSAVIAGILTLLIQLKEIIKKDMDDDSAKSFTPLMFVR